MLWGYERHLTLNPTNLTAVSGDRVNSLNEMKSHLLSDTRTIKHYFDNRLHLSYLAERYDEQQTWSKSGRLEYDDSVFSAYLVSLFALVTKITCQKKLAKLLIGNSFYKSGYVFFVQSTLVKATFYHLRQKNRDR
jgi:hypothetical protein